MKDFSGREDLDLTDSRTGSQGRLMVCAQGCHAQNPVNENETG